MLTISLIAAVSDNGIIGNENKLPWHLPEDLQHFKHYTTNKVILMGRNTYTSLGKALPNRTNLVLTSNKQFVAPGCTLVTSLDQAITIAKDITQNQTLKELIIIGGAQVYKSALSIADKLCLTYVHCNAVGDAHFPAFNAQEWQEQANKQYTSKTGLNYSIVTLIRI
jgi:dihydrofolate reductase